MGQIEMSSGQESSTLILKARIESYTGPQPMTIFTDLIRQSVAKVIELIPRELLAPYTTLMGGIGSGASLEGKKLVMVGNNAREVTETESYRYMDPGSIFYVATSRDQIFWRSDKMVHSLPEDADCVVIDYSSVAETDTEIACLPPQFTEAVVLDVAIQVLSSQLAQLTGTAFALNIKKVMTPEVVDLVYPQAISTLTLAWSDVGDITNTFDADIANGLMALRDALDGVKGEVETQLSTGSEDIELGMARLNHAKSLLDEYIEKSDLALKKIMANLETEKLNKVKEYEKTLEEAHNSLAKASQELQLFTAHGQLILAEHKENMERAAAFAQTMQLLERRFAMIFAPFQTSEKSQ